MLLSNTQAMFQNAWSKALKDNEEVCIYYGTGRGPIKQVEGTFYMYEDAVIVSLGQRFLPTPKKAFVAISGCDS